MPEAVGPAMDFYDTDYSESGGLFAGTGDWDLMGGGAYNGSYDTQNPTLQDGACPAHMNPFWRFTLVGLTNKSSTPRKRSH